MISKCLFNPKPRAEDVVCDCTELGWLVSDEGMKSINVLITEAAIRQSCL